MHVCKFCGLSTFVFIQETSVESCEYNGVIYRVGDFVYVEQR